MRCITQVIKCDRCNNNESIITNDLEEAYQFFKNKGYVRLYDKLDWCGCKLDFWLNHDCKECSSEQQRKCIDENECILGGEDNNKRADAIMYGEEHTEFPILDFENINTLNLNIGVVKF